MRANANKQAGRKISKRQEKRKKKKEKRNKALAEKAIDQQTKKRQAICGLREGYREGERVANSFSLPILKSLFR
jgi:hypothetical protein